MAKIKDSKELSESMARTLDFYTRAILKHGTGMSAMDHVFGKPLRYKKVKEPVYLWIPIPKIEWKHYDIDYYYEGILIWFDWRRLLKIGYKTVNVPVYKKRKGTITFKRFGE